MYKSILKSSYKVYDSFMFVAHKTRQIRKLNWSKWEQPAKTAISPLSSPLGMIRQESYIYASATEIPKVDDV